MNAAPGSRGQRFDEALDRALDGAGLPHADWTIVSSLLSLFLSLFLSFFLCFFRRWLL